MPSSEPVNWQPMSQMPLVAGLIDGALRDTRDHLHTLTKARAKPHVLDDATVDRIERVHREQLEFVDNLRGANPTLEDPRPVRCANAGTGPLGRAEPPPARGHHGRPRMPSSGESCDTYRDPLRNPMTENP
jgi:hypothetical protein